MNLDEKVKKVELDEARVEVEVSLRERETDAMQKGEYRQTNTNKAFH